MSEDSRGALVPNFEAKSQIMRSEGGAMAPRNLGEALEFAKIISQSELVPKAFKGKPGDVLAAIQMGAEIGLPPMQALQNIAVINGRPSLWGDAVLAVVMAHPDYVSCQEMDLREIAAANSATFTITRRGHAPHTVTFSMEDAKRAGLAGKSGPWKEYTSRMLQLRARAFGCRDRFPDALRGLHVAEEARDMEVHTTATAVPDHIANGDTKALEAELLSDKTSPPLDGERNASLERGAGAVDDHHPADMLPEEQEEMEL